MTNLDFRSGLKHQGTLLLRKLLKLRLEGEVILLRGNQPRGGMISIYKNPNVGKNLTHFRDLSSIQTQKGSVPIELRVEERGAQQGS